MRLTDFDVLTFDMIGTLIDFATGVLDFVRPRILRTRPAFKSYCASSWPNCRREIGRRCRPAPRLW
jgi:hypothetical protein